MADERYRIDPSHELPLPEEQRPETLGRQCADPSLVESHKLGESFADPNALDDQRLGKAFEESNSSRKKRPKERLHKPKNRKVLYAFIACVVVFFLVVFVISFLRLHSRNKETQKEADARKNADPVVEVTRVQRAPAGGGLVIPGTTNALTEAFVYARANGRKFV